MEGNILYLQDNVAFKIYVTIVYLRQFFMGILSVVYTETDPWHKMTVIRKET